MGCFSCRTFKYYTITTNLNCERNILSLEAQIETTQLKKSHLYFIEFDHNTINAGRFASAKRTSHFPFSIPVTYPLVDKLAFVLNDKSLEFDIGNVDGEKTLPIFIAVIASPSKPEAVIGFLDIKLQCNNNDWTICQKGTA